TNKQRYGATKTHQVLLKEGSTVSLKNVQKLMKQLNLRLIVVNSKVFQSIISKENLLNQNFSTKTICEKCGCYLSSTMDLHTNTQQEKWNKGLKPTK
uniref:IS3 family transposase n=1 Tax=Enterococcus faecium TaxID=1352 RepID=UPI0023B222BE